MVKDFKTDQIESRDRRKSAWQAPALTRIAASEAEISTRANDDGPFSSS